jgi:type IV pilus assembly protein PilX
MRCKQTIRRLYLSACPRQGGAALIVTLLMLIAVLMLGLSAAQIAVQDEKAARNDRDRQVAFQAAEAGLTDAEFDIENSPDAARSRSWIFTARGEGFDGACGKGAGNIHAGLCALVEEGAPPAWQSVDLLDSTVNAATARYGQFTGHVLQTGEGAMPAMPPRYVVERLPYTQAGAAADIADVGSFYRITAIGFGARDTTRVILQSFYRKGS